VDIAGQKVGDDGFEVGCSRIHLAPYRAKAAEIVLHQVDRLIVAIGHDRRRPARIAH
jgi:hypothetical protein